jgi:hypothetical protein
MNARLVGRRIRWEHLASVSACVLAGACAEPSTVDPRLVPEASIDVAPEASDADAEGSADVSTGGSGGSGGSGGTGGTGGSGGTGGMVADAADARSETGDPGDARDGVADALPDTAMDAPVVDMTLPPEGAADVRDSPSEPPQDTGARDGADVSGDRG